MTDRMSGGATLRFRPRNYVLLVGAILALGFGYYLLQGGSTGVAPVLLVLGYCVLFPLGLAL